MSLDRLFTFEGTGTLLQLPFVRSALLAAAMLGLIAGLLAPLVVARGMAFAVHGTAELAFTGGAAALLLGISVQLGAVGGAIIAAVLFGLLGLRQRERDAVIGVLLAFGLGLGVLMLSLYDGRASNKFGLLTGSIVSVDATNLYVLAATAAVVLSVLAVFYRPLLFSSVDPGVAAARGVPVRLLAPVFAVLIGLTTALAVPIVGAILVLAVMVTPGAAAAQVTANPLKASLLSVLFAETALLGGIVLSLGPGLPISGYAATIVFVCYVLCRIVGALQRRRTSTVQLPAEELGGLEPPDGQTTAPGIVDLDGAAQRRRRTDRPEGPEQTGSEGPDGVAPDRPPAARAHSRG